MPRAAPALAAISALALASTAWAHFPILLAERPTVPRGETAAIDYTFGHPFEAEVAEAARPARIVAHPPEGDAVDLTDALEATGSADARGWTVPYTPGQRGDHVVALEAAASSHGGATYRDFAKLVLHVPSVQKGWDRRVGHPLEIVPHTRPYGLREGALFRASVLAEGEPLSGARVAVEAHNPTAPQELPPEPFITGIEKTDADGDVAVVLDRPGWWLLCARHEAAGDVRRAALWVHVGRP